MTSVDDPESEDVFDRANRLLRRRDTRKRASALLERAAARRGERLSGAAWSQSYAASGAAETAVSLAPAAPPSAPRTPRVAPEPPVSEGVYRDALYGADVAATPRYQVGAPRAPRRGQPAVIHPDPRVQAAVMSMVPPGVNPAVYAEAFAPVADLRGQPFDAKIDYDRVERHARDGFIAAPLAGGKWGLYERQADGSVKPVYTADPRHDPETVLGLLRPLFVYQTSTAPKQMAAYEQIEAQQAQEHDVKERAKEARFEQQQTVVEGLGAVQRAEVGAQQLLHGADQVLTTAAQGALRDFPRAALEKMGAGPAEGLEPWKAKAHGTIHGVDVAQASREGAGWWRQQAGHAEAQSLSPQNLEALRAAVADVSTAPAQRAEYSALLEQHQRQAPERDRLGHHEVAPGSTDTTAAPGIGETMAHLLETGRVPEEDAPWWANVLKPFEVGAVPFDLMRELAGGKRITGDWRADILPDLLMLAATPEGLRSISALGRRVKNMDPRAAARAVLADLKSMTATEAQAARHAAERGLFVGEIPNRVDVPARRALPNVRTHKMPQPPGSSPATVPGADEISRPDTAQRVSDLMSQRASSPATSARPTVTSDDAWFESLEGVARGRKDPKGTRTRVIAQAEPEPGYTLRQTRRRTPEDELRTQAARGDREGYADALERVERARSVGGEDVRITTESETPGFQRVEGRKLLNRKVAQIERALAREDLKPASRAKLIEERERLRMRLGHEPGGAREEAELLRRAREIEEEVTPGGVAGRRARERRDLEGAVEGRTDRYALKERLEPYQSPFEDAVEPIAAGGDARLTGKIPRGLDDAIASVSDPTTRDTLRIAARDARAGKLGEAKAGLRRAGRLAFQETGLKDRAALEEFYQLIESRTPAELRRGSPAERLRRTKARLEPTRPAGNREGEWADAKRELDRPEGERAARSAAQRQREVTALKREYAEVMRRIAKLRKQRAVTPAEGARALRRLKREYRAGARAVMEDSLSRNVTGTQAQRGRVQRAVDELMDRIHDPRTTPRDRAAAWAQVRRYQRALDDLGEDPTEGATVTPRAQREAPNLDRARRFDMVLAEIAADEGVPLPRWLSQRRGGDPVAAPEAPAVFRAQDAGPEYATAHPGLRFLHVEEDQPGPYARRGRRVVFEDAQGRRHEVREQEVQRWWEARQRALQAARDRATARRSAATGGAPGDGRRVIELDEPPYQAGPEAPDPQRTNRFRHILDEIHAAEAAPAGAGAPEAPLPPRRLELDATPPPAGTRSPRELAAAADELVEAAARAEERGNHILAARLRQAADRVRAGDADGELDALRRRVAEAEREAAQLRQVEEAERQATPAERRAAAEQRARERQQERGRHPDAPEPEAPPAPPRATRRASMDDTSPPADASRPVAPAEPTPPPAAAQRPPRSVGRDNALVVHDSENRAYPITAARVDIADLWVSSTPGPFQSRDLTRQFETAMISRMGRDFDRTRFARLDTGTPTEGAPVIWRDPVDGRNYVLAGNKRTMAARLAGIEGEVDVRWFRGTREEAVRLAAASQDSGAGTRSPLQRASARAQSLGLEATDAPTNLPAAGVTVDNFRQVLHDNPAFARKLPLTGEAASDFALVREALVGMLPQQVRDVAALAGEAFEDAIAGAAPRLLALRSLREQGRVRAEFDVLHLFERASVILAETGGLSREGSISAFVTELRDLVAMRGGFFGAERRIDSISKLELGFVLGLRQLARRTDPAEATSAAFRAIYDLALAPENIPGQRGLFGPVEVDVIRMVDDAFGERISSQVRRWDGPLGITPDDDLSAFAGGGQYAPKTDAFVTFGEGHSGPLAPPSPRTAAATPKVLYNPEEILRWTLQKLGLWADKRVTKRMYGGKALGLWNRFKRAISLADTQDVPTAMHEVGHGLVSSGWFNAAHPTAAGPPGLNALPRPVQMELGVMSASRWAGGYPPSKWVEEGFVEAFAQWAVYNNHHALVPQWARWWDDWLIANPDKAAVLERTRDFITAWDRADPEKAMKAAFAPLGGEHAIERYGVSWWGKQLAMATRGRMIDDLLPLETYVRDAMKHHGMKWEDLPAHLNPAEVARNAKMTSQARSEAYVLYGELETPRGLVKGKGLREIVKDAGSLTDFEDLLAHHVGQHVLELADNTRYLANEARIGTLRTRIQRLRALIARSPAGQRGPLNAQLQAFERAYQSLIDARTRLAPKFTPINAETAQLAVDQIRDRWRRSGRLAAMDAVGDDLKEFIDRPFRLLRDNGVVSPQAYRAMKAAYPWYFSLARDTRAEAQVSRLFGTSHGQFQRVASPIYKLEGSTAGKLKHPIEALIHTVSVKIDAANRARVAKTLIDFAETFPGQGQWVSRAGAVPERQLRIADDYLNTILNSGMSMTLNTQDDIRTAVANMAALQGRHNTVVVWHKGKPVAYNVSASLTEALAGMGPQQSNLALDLLAAPARLARAGATSWNPGFALVTNTLRDLQTALVQGEGSAGEAAMRLARTFRNQGQLYGLPLSRMRIGLHDDVLSAFRAMGLEGASLIGQDVSRTPATIARRLGAQNRAERAISGSTRGRGVLTAVGLRRTYDAMVRSPAARRAYNVAVHPVEAFRHVLNASEMAPRLAEFERVLRKMGWRPGARITQEQMHAAARAAAEITIDFRRAGTWGRQISRYVPFFNANLQGLSKFARAHQRNPIGAMTRGVAYLTTLGLMEYAISGDKPWWKDSLPWQRNLFYQFELENEEILRIPIPHEWGFFYGKLPQYVLDDDPDAARMVREGLFNLLPDLKPPAIAAPVEAVMNYDSFREMDLYPYYTARTTPNELHVRPWTTTISREVAMATAKSDAWRAAFGEALTPVGLDHVLNGWSGGMYGDIARAPGAVKRIFSGDKGKGLYDLPVAGRLFQRPTEGRAVRELRDELEAIRSERNRWVAYRKQEGMAAKRANQLFARTERGRKLASLEATLKKINAIREKEGDAGVQRAALAEMADEASAALGK